MASARDDRAVALRLAAAVALFLALIGQAQVTILDGSSMLGVAQAIVHHGTLAVPAKLGVLGHDGLYYSKYGILLPLLSVIPVAIAQPIGLITGHLDKLEAALAASLMPLISGGLAAALFMLGRRLGAPRGAAALVALGTLLGTYLLPYGRDFFTEPLVTLGLVVMVERALAGRELQSGSALAIAVLARPQAAAFAPLLLAYILLRGRGLRAVAQTLPPLAVAGAITVAYNLVRFADPLQFGYRRPEDPGFTTPLLHGTQGLLFSPEKSVFLFAPAIVLVPFAAAALWRRGERATVGFVLALFTAVFGLAATWWSWMGGWSWGPRLIIPGVALALALVAPWIAGSTRRMALAAALFAAGFAISLSAVIAPAGAQLLLDPGESRDGPRIVRQYTILREATSNSVHAAGDPAARADDSRRYLALWQAGTVREFGRSGLIPAVLGSLLLLGGLVAVARPLPRLLRSS